MIRNTRSAIVLTETFLRHCAWNLPPGGKIYEDVGAHLKTLNLKKPMLNMLLREAGAARSSAGEPPQVGGQRLRRIIAMMGALEETSRGRPPGLVLKSPAEKKIILRIPQEHGLRAALLESAGSFATSGAT